MIFIPSESIDLANCLASLSVGNVLVCLAAGGRGFNRVARFGASTETDHRWGTAAFKPNGYAIRVQ